MTAVAETLGVARSNLMARKAAARPAKRRGRKPLPDGSVVAAIEGVLAEQPTYGYQRVWAVLRRQARSLGQTPWNRKRIYRVMKVHGMLLQRHAGGPERRHDGKIAVERSNLRWCSDGFELASDDGDKVRVAFSLDCCDREAMSVVATPDGIGGEDVRDLMLAAVEHRFGPVDKAPEPIEWLSDNGSGYIAGDTKAFARGIGLEPRTTPVRSPQSNGMAEAFVRTIKRDYARVSFLPDARAIMDLLPKWIAHYNEVHPHRALGYRSPREFIAAQKPR